MLWENEGFTLIELSIVLVIIGLVVGGVLVGQNLIKAAEARAQISQIEKYDQAVNTFRAKFQAIPGDMDLATAKQHGFTTDPTCVGQPGARDGNSLIDGSTNGPLTQGAGETALFWADLSSGIAGNLVGGQFPNNGAAATICANGGGRASAVSPVLSTTPGSTFIGDYYPIGKIGQGAYVYVYEASGYNWFGLSTVSDQSQSGIFTSTAVIPVIQAYNIDKKVDDGIPTTGAVQAVYLNADNYATAAAPNDVTDTAITCYNAARNTYSLSSLANYGAGGNCALSFRFQ